MSNLSELFDSIGQSIQPAIEQIKAEAAPLEQLLVDITASTGIQPEIKHYLCCAAADSNSAARGSLSVAIPGLTPQQLLEFAEARHLHYFDPENGETIMISTRRNLNLHVHGLTFEKTHHDHPLHQNR